MPGCKVNYRSTIFKSIYIVKLIQFNRFEKLITSYNPDMTIIVKVLTINFIYFHGIQHNFTNPYVTVLTITCPFSIKMTTVSPRKVSYDNTLLKKRIINTRNR